MNGSCGSSESDTADATKAHHAERDGYIQRQKLSTNRIELPSKVLKSFSNQSAGPDGSLAVEAASGRKSPK
jgi:hypothetical protein